VDGCYISTEELERRNTYRAVDLALARARDDRDHEIFSVWISKTKRSWGSPLVDDYTTLLYSSLGAVTLSAGGVVALLIVVVRRVIQKSRDRYHYFPIPWIMDVTMRAAALDDLPEHQEKVNNVFAHYEDRCNSIMAGSWEKLHRFQALLECFTWV